MTAQQKKPADISDLDPQSLAAIRDLLATEPEVIPEPVAQRVAKKKSPQHLETTAPRARPSAAPVAPAQEHAAQPRMQLDAPTAGRVAGLKSKLGGYRPTPKHLIWAAVILLVVMRPWLVMGLLFLTAFIMTGVFLIVGYDGFWHRAMGLARWYAKRRPSRAAQVHEKLDNFAVRFDAFLDRFPDGWVDGLYLPDFGELAAADARHDAVLDRRFDSLRET